LSRPVACQQGALQKPQTGCQLGTNGSVHCFEAGQWWCSKSQPSGVVLHPDQACATFLDQNAVRLGLSPGLQPGVCGTKRWVPSERELLAAREDAHTVIGTRISWREKKGGLGEVGPFSEVLHRLAAQSLCVNHHCQRVAAIWLS